MPNLCVKCHQSMWGENFHWECDPRTLALRDQLKQFEKLNDSLKDAVKELKRLQESKRYDERDCMVPGLF